MKTRSIQAFWSLLLLVAISSCLPKKGKSTSSTKEDESPDISSSSEVSEQGASKQGGCGDVSPLQANLDELISQRSAIYTKYPDADIFGGPESVTAPIKPRDRQSCEVLFAIYRGCTNRPAHQAWSRCLFLNCGNNPCAPEYNDFKRCEDEEVNVGQANIRYGDRVKQHEIAQSEVIALETIDAQISSIQTELQRCRTVN